MKKTTNNLAMATPCPNLNVKRPMSRGPQHLNPSPKTFLKLILIFWSLASSGAFAQAQNSLPNQTQAKPQATQTLYTLKGKVTDTQNTPLQGATITDSQSQKTTQSDQNGNFALSTITLTGKITVTYLGYRPQTLNYNTATPLNIQLTEDRSQLQSVEINTGYYSVKQKNLTGSISSVKSGQIEKQPISNPILALQGRVTGAYVQQVSGTPGAAVNILIRGQNSITAATTPLYLIDGIPYGQQSLSNGLTQSRAVFGPAGSSPFATLSPEDIESISILKDADATAIYGSRGANGVVLITTKKGKSGKTAIQLSSSFAQSKVAQRIEMMDTQNYLQVRKAALALDGINAPTASDFDLNGTWDQNRYTNWQNELWARTAQSSNHRLSISGGNANTSFYLSGSHQWQGTIVAANQRYQKTTAQLSASHTSTDQKFSANASLSFNSDNSTLANAEITSRILTLSPNAPALYHPDGSLNWANSSWTHPLNTLESPYTGKNQGLIANTTLIYTVFKGLKASLSGGYTRATLDDHSYIPVSYYDPAQGMTPANSISDNNASWTSSLLVEPQLSYEHQDKTNKLSLLLGYSYQSQQREQLVTRGLGYTSDAQIKNLRAASSVTVRDYNLSDYRYSGLYARAGYTLQDRYIVNLTGRRDGSSRFGPGRRLASFGALGLAYLASETQLVKEQLPFISLLKLRASYGTSGNDQIGDYEYLNTYASAGGYNGVAGLAPVRLFNPDFAWELNRKFEAGLELALFKDKVRGSISYYRNRSTNQLIDYPLPATTGFTSIRNNLAATVQNSGLEMELSFSPLKGKLQWESGLNFTLPRNKLVAFPGLANSSYASQYVIGESLGIARAYQLLGVDPQTGVYTFADLNGDGTITAGDRLAIIRRGQQGYGGWNNSFSYKNFQFDILFQFVVQRLNNFNSLTTTPPGASINMPMAFAGKFWTKPGDIAQYQRPTAGTYAPAVIAYNNYYLSTAASSDACFARLKNLSLSYTAKNILPKTTVKLFLQGQNLWTWTKFFGLEPENASNITPNQQTFQLGLQLSL